ncbi:MAG: Tad domain-containing protein [Pseudomonadota bacterium]
MLFRRFVADEQAAMTPLMLVLFVGILLLTGVGLDLLKHEAERADLQAALDRGVLAAASMTQTQDPEDVIQSYIDAGTPFADRVTLTVSADLNVNNRTIDAAARYQTETMFLSLVGVSEITVPAAAAAASGTSNLELSLVLDKSGSMRSSLKLPVLQDAADGFLDIIEASYGADQVVINLVPYGSNSNPGSEIFDWFEVSGRRISHTCPRFAGSHYTHLDLPGHGALSYSRWDDCPPENVRIAYLSNDFNDLRTRIEAMTAYGYTGTYIAMKWAVALLNPSIRTDDIYDVDGQAASFTDKLIDAGLMSISHAALPVDWSDEDSLKVVVLMTDGAINPPWGRRSQSPSISTGERYFEQICDLAKARGVIVYTIAFEASYTASQQMADCASSASTFYDVDGIDLVAAFEQIAQDISKLRLTE